MIPWIIALTGWAAFAILAVWSIRKVSAYAKMQSELEHMESSSQRLEQTFKALASDALSQSSESFLKLATERLDKKTTEASGVLEQRVVEFQKLIDPIKQVISRVETDLSKVEKDRLEQFSRLSEQLIAVTQSSEVLRKEASGLSSALRRPEVRGSWGEIQLRRVVELAGMSAHCDFEEQVNAPGERLLRPDMIVSLPNDRSIIVDSKAVLDAFLDATQAETPEKKQEALVRHARNIRSRVAELSKKSYWSQFAKAPDFCILFVPNEALLYSAVDVDKKIIEDALEERIVIATPTTLVALLKAVAYGWQQSLLATNAQEIINAAKEFYERVGKWTEHVQDVGTRLEGVVKSYNSAIGSLESRVLPSVRKFQELGVTGTPIPPIEGVELVTRSLRDS